MSHHDRPLASPRSFAAGLSEKRTPMSAGAWSFGDRVRHAARPEWGIGLVTAVEPAVIEGKPTQRLTIRFERAGLKKLAAVAADLVPAGVDSPLTDAEEHRAAAAALGQNDDSGIRRILAAVPEDARDPFRSLADRFARTLDLYRFTGQGASLLDWAAMQTGLADPLSRFSRHDLETYFERFRRALDTHARQIAFDIAKADPAAASRIIAEANTNAKAAMRRFAVRR